MPQRQRPEASALTGNPCLFARSGIWLPRDFEDLDTPSGSVCARYRPHDQIRHTPGPATLAPVRRARSLDLVADLRSPSQVTENRGNQID